MENKSVVEPSAEPGVVVPMPGPAAKEERERLEEFGDMVPFADPAYYQSVSLPVTF